MENNQHTRTSLELTEDVRVFAGLRGAIEHIASRHGLEKQESSEFSDSAEQACRKALSSVAGEPACYRVTLDEFSDRLEFLVECSADHVGAKASYHSAHPSKFVKYFHKKPANI